MTGKEREKRAFRQVLHRLHKKKTLVGNLPRQRKEDDSAKPPQLGGKRRGGVCGGGGGGGKRPPDTARTRGEGGKYVMKTIERRKKKGKTAPPVRRSSGKERMLRPCGRVKTDAAAVDRRKQEKKEHGNFFPVLTARGERREEKGEESGNSRRLGGNCHHISILERGGG